MSSTFALDYTCLVADHGGPIRLRIPLRIPLVSTPVSRRDDNAQQQQLLWAQTCPFVSFIFWDTNPFLYLLP
jgi:hypothetical protein